MTKIKKETMIDRQIANCSREVDDGVEMIGYYEWLSSQCTETKDKANADLKVEAMKKLVENNRATLSLMQEYKKTL
jgi:hypothetical protein